MASRRWRCSRRARTSITAIGVRWSPWPSGWTTRAWRLTSVHAPIAATFDNGAWREPFTLAATDEPRRKRAVEETRAALELATVVPYRFLVTHAGSPAPYGTAADNSRASLVRSLAELAPVAAGVGVRIAVEVIPNALSGSSALVGLLEDDEELAGAGHLPGRGPRAPAGRRRRGDRDVLGPSSSPRTCTTTAARPTITSCPGRA